MAITQTTCISHWFPPVYACADRIKITLIKHQINKLTGAKISHLFSLASNMSLFFRFLRNLVI